VTGSGQRLSIVDRCNLDQVPVLEAQALNPVPEHDVLPVGKHRPVGLNSDGLSNFLGEDLVESGGEVRKNRAGMFPKSYGPQLRCLDPVVRLKEAAPRRCLW
jgi:hypothetical protein